jgi:hypothetical protein
MSPSLPAAIQKLKRHWADQGLLTSGVRPAAQLGWALPGGGVLPPDFQILYSALDGMDGFYCNKCDAEGFLWYPLAYLAPVTILPHPVTADSPYTVYEFMDYLTQCWWYGFRCLPGGAYEIGVMPTRELFYPITRSLTEWIDLYLADAPILYPHPALSEPASRSMETDVSHVLDRLDLPGKQLLARRLLGDQWAAYALIYHHGEDPDDALAYGIGYRRGSGGLLIENAHNALLSVALLRALGAPVRTVGAPWRLRLAYWWQRLLGADH